MTILEKKDLKGFEFNSFLDYNPLSNQMGISLLHKKFVKKSKYRKKCYESSRCFK